MSYRLPFLTSRAYLDSSISSEGTGTYLFFVVLLLNPGPDMKKLSTLCWILQDSSLSLDRAILSSYSSENFQSECQRILDQLQATNLFSMARKVAQLAELPVDNVVLQEVPWGHSVESGWAAAYALTGHAFTLSLQQNLNAA